jgi:AraC-like DNA-binding protein
MTARPAQDLDAIPAARQRVAGLVALPAVLRRYGVDVAAVLAAAGLPPDALDDSDRTIPFSTLHAVIIAAVEQTRAPHLGLDIGAAWSLADTGLAMRLARACATLGEAIETFVANQWLNSDGQVVFQLRYPERATVGYVVARPLPGALVALHDGGAASIVSGIRSMVGDDWQPESVQLPRGAPADRAPYRTFFRCPVVFDAEHTAVHFPTRDLLRPLPAADAALRRRLEAEAARQPDAALATRLYRSLRVLLLDGAVHADTVARHLSLSRRTLDRRLREHGTSFKAVLDEVRLEVARHLLRETALPVFRIAQALGYNDETAFIRAFRGWTGVSPGRWREQNAVA